MIRKYWWLVVFAVFVFLFDTLLMQWTERSPHNFPK
ncbi:DUF2556 family protein, partial [Escherichia coli]